MSEKDKNRRNQKQDHKENLRVPKKEPYKRKKSGRRGYNVGYCMFYPDDFYEDE